jgi:hypothetical protein
MADNYQARKVKVSIPSNIIQEIEYRGYRIIQTDDKDWVASGQDAYGFTNTRVFVIFDEFDEPAMPVGMMAHWTVHEAIAAIEMKDTVLPVITAGKWATSALYEFNLMRARRRHAWKTHASLATIKKLCTDAQAFDDNPTADILAELDNLSSFFNVQATQAHT